MSKKRKHDSDDVPSVSVNDLAEEKLPSHTREAIERTQEREGGGIERDRETGQWIVWIRLPIPADLRKLRRFIGIMATILGCGYGAVHFLAKLQDAAAGHPVEQEAPRSRVARGSPPGDRGG